MRKRRYLIALIIAAVVIAAALAMRGHQGGWLSRVGMAIHGR